MGDILYYRLLTVYAEIIVGPSFCCGRLPSLREKTPNTEVNRWFAVEWRFNYFRKLNRVFHFNSWHFLVTLNISIQNVQRCVF